MLILFFLIQLTSINSFKQTGDDNNNNDDDDDDNN